MPCFGLLGMFGGFVVGGFGGFEMSVCVRCLGYLVSCNVLRF